MLMRHCQGCGRAVDIHGPHAKLIAPARLALLHAGARPLEADLCRRCFATLRSRYFGVPAEPLDEEDGGALALAGPPTMPLYLENGQPAEATP